MTTARTQQDDPTYRAAVKDQELAERHGLTVGDHVTIGHGTKTWAIQSFWDDRGLATLRPHPDRGQGNTTVALNRLKAVTS